MPASFSRRRFGTLLAASATAAAALPVAAQAAPAHKTQGKILKPPRLRQGDKIALITPSGLIEDKEIEKSIRNVEAMGLQAVVGKNARARMGLYGGTPQQRLEDMHWAFSDPDIKGIWCIRGGSGGISLLDHIDYALVKKHPKVFMGYSDTTALHLALHRKTGLVCFHSPVGTSSLPPYARAHLQAIVMDPQPNYTMTNAMENHEKAIEKYQYKARSIRPGQAEGRLVGGNLVVAASLEGTPYGMQAEGRLLFLEEVNEEPYRVDRWITQLHLAHNLDKCAGVMLGVLEGCEPKPTSPSMSLAETLNFVLGERKVPTVTGYSFGHIANQMTLPYGVMARLDSNTQSVTLLEPAVL